MSTGTTPEFRITHSLQAPRGLVWKAWTETERLDHWWGPVGLKLTVGKLEVRPGGTFHYCMTAPNGQSMWGKFVYREVSAPTRFTYVLSFADEHENLVRHPGAPTWPLEMFCTVTLTEQDGGTALTLTATPLQATEEETKTFADSFDSMKGGFGATFKQLVEYLAKAEK